MSRSLLLATLVLVMTGCKPAALPAPTVPNDIPSSKAVDARQKTITTYVIHAAKVELDGLPRGAVLALVTDDYPAMEPDLRAWTARTGNRLVDVRRDKAQAVFFIEKGAPKEPAAPKTVAIVVSDAGLEELLSPLGFALSAALMGEDVHIYFQGPAIRVLERGFRAKLKGAGRPFSRIARNGMASTGHIEPQHKLAQLAALGARFYACAASMDHFEVDPADLAFENITIAEYFTFMNLMLHADVQLYEH